MGLDPTLCGRFRDDLQRSRDARRDAWDASSRWVAGAKLPETLERLSATIRASALPEPLRDALLEALHEKDVLAKRPASAEVLKALTGLPLSKAIRALCVHFGIVDARVDGEEGAAASPASVEDSVKRSPSPYDLLLEVDSPALLDLGAGDLSFGAELADHYVPALQRRGRRLVLHCIERLSPSSRLGSLLHADPQHLQRLRQPSPALEFRFWAGHDMFELDRLQGARPRYTIVTCHAPATPAFAYEPTRLSDHIIRAHLAQTKGAFRRVTVEGEEALEVMHRDRPLLFPPWKFDIRGPLALLDFSSRKGSLCLLGAVDNEVFWELLAQLLADDRVRPRDVLLTPEVLPDVFGSLYGRLSELPIGQRLDLSTIAELRPALPRVLTPPPSDGSSFRFRYVEVRRGAVFPGIPASRTARLFKDMPEEAPPWSLALVPDRPL